MARNAQKFGEVAQFVPISAWLSYEREENWSFISVNTGSDSRLSFFIEVGSPYNFGMQLLGNFTTKFETTQVYFKSRKLEAT